MPSLYMSRELPEARRALPVLKVLHRNTEYIQEYADGGKHEALIAVADTGFTAERSSPRDILRVDGRQVQRIGASFAIGASDLSLRLQSPAILTDLGSMSIAWFSRGWLVLSCLGSRAGSHAAPPMALVVQW